MATKSEATKSEATLIPNAKLVSLYIETAHTRNADGWSFIKATKGLSVRVIQDSIKQGKKESGIALPDITPTKAQHFETMLTLSTKLVGLELKVPFAKVYQVSEKADRAWGAKEARAKASSAVDFDEFVKALPKTVRDREKSPSEVSASMAQFSTEQILEELNNRIPADESDRQRFIRAIASIAKIARAIKVERVA